MKINFLGFQLYVKFKRTHAPNSLGVLSLTHDKKHVVLLDFDTFHFYDNLQVLINNLKEFQEDYDLGDFDIYETSGGYHAVCFTKVSYGDYLQIMNEINGLDYGFKIQAVLRPEQATTLRFYSLNENKYSKYITTVKSNYGYEREESEAHKQIFNHLKGLPVKQTKEPLPVVWYFHNKTAHGVKK